METQVLTQSQTKHSHGNPDATHSVSYQGYLFVFDTPLFTSCEVSSDSFIHM